MLSEWGFCYWTHISYENRKRRCTIRQLWKDLGLVVTVSAARGGALGSSVALCLRVDGRHVAQAAVEAAPREEYALLRAGRELATPSSLQLLAQAEAWDTTRACLGGRFGGAVTDGRTDRRAGRLVGGGACLTCSASVATRHVEAILRMRGVGVRIPRNLDTSGRGLVGLSEMEAALKGALVL